MWVEFCLYYHTEVDLLQRQVFFSGSNTTTKLQITHCWRADARKLSQWVSVVWQIVGENRSGGGLPELCQTNRAGALASAAASTPSVSEALDQLTQRFLCNCYWAAARLQIPLWEDFIQRGWTHEFMQHAHTFLHVSFACIWTNHLLTTHVLISK